MCMYMSISCTHLIKPYKLHSVFSFYTTLMNKVPTTLQGFSYNNYQ